jgi:hypothetical protein
MIFVLARLVTASKENTYSFVKPSKKSGLGQKATDPDGVTQTRLANEKHRKFEIRDLRKTAATGTGPRRRKSIANLRLQI